MGAISFHLLKARERELFIGTFLDVLFYDGSLEPERNFLQLPNDSHGGFQPWNSIRFTIVFKLTAENFAIIKYSIFDTNVIANFIQFGFYVGICVLNKRRRHIVKKLCSVEYGLLSDFLFRSLLIGSDIV